MTSTKWRKRFYEAYESNNFDEAEKIWRAEYPGSMAVLGKDIHTLYRSQKHNDRQVNKLRWLVVFAAVILVCLIALLALYFL